jgi:hypothetical protein
MQNCIGAYYRRTHVDTEVPTEPEPRTESSMPEPRAPVPDKTEAASASEDELIRDDPLPEEQEIQKPPTREINVISLGNEKKKLAEQIKRRNELEN